jgi:hypothetical protein
MGGACPLSGVSSPIEAIRSVMTGFGVQQLVATPGTIRLHPSGGSVTVPHTRAVMSEGSMRPANFGYASGALSAVSFDVASGSGS